MKELTYSHLLLLLCSCANCSSTLSLSLTDILSIFLDLLFVFFGFIQPEWQGENR